MGKTIKFKNAYTEERKKEEYYREVSEERKTNQDQITSASITEMAKRFGIDAIMAKANQTQIDENLQNELYGHDYTKMFKSKDELLKTREKLKQLFERIPAKIRKEKFNDKVENLLNAYTDNNIEQLKELNKIGIVSKTQIEQVENYNKKIELEKNEKFNKQMQEYIKLNKIELIKKDKIENEE